MFSCFQPTLLSSFLCFSFLFISVTPSHSRNVHHWEKNNRFQSWKDSFDNLRNSDVTYFLYETQHTTQHHTQHHTQLHNPTATPTLDRFHNPSKMQQKTTQPTQGQPIHQMNTRHINHSHKPAPHTSRTHTHHTTFRVPEWGEAYFYYFSPNYFNFVCFLSLFILLYFIFI